MPGHYGIVLFHDLSALRDVGTSRRAILDAFLPASDVTFVRGPGNLGDHLIWVGVRELLRGIPHREIGLESLPLATGEVGLLAGAGGFSKVFHEQMPLVLEMMDQQFERVVVLPSSFDPSVPDVRESLERTSAIVFAREPVSFQLISRLCDARLALDCAFFADLGAYSSLDADGVLHAFRTDGERHDQAVQLPDDNVDVSVTAQDLDGFLRTIAAASEVHTDRTHVMITAAMLGRAVRYRPAAAHKVTAIAEWALQEFPVSPLPDEPDRSKSETEVQSIAVDQAFLHELGDGIVTDEATIRTLERALAAHPRAAAAAPMVVDVHGRVQYAGGVVDRHDELVTGRRAVDDVSEPCYVDWTPVAGTLWRRDAHVPVDAAAGRFGAIERAIRRPSPILYVPTAVVTDTTPAPSPPADEFSDRTRRLRAATAAAWIVERHGVIVTEFFDEFPWMAWNGRYDVQSARLLFRLLRAEGMGGIHRIWSSGDITPLFRGPM